MKQSKKYRYMPLLMALCIVIGVVIGTFFANHFSSQRLNIINSGSNRLNNLLHIIDDQYVDKVNLDSLVEKAIPQILGDLDPHSVYISAKDVQTATDDLKGSFSGVGIEFVIREDTIHIQGVIKNGPAERAGLLAGDKIVPVDDKPFVGKTVTNEEAQHRLKGPKDTKVKIGVLRYGEKKLQQYVVTRGEIPTKSVTATYMLDDDTGYIRIKNFGENTYPEMLIALAKLSQENFSNLIIDLRDNTGGYLQSAVQIINEFLPNNKLIVYTQGRKSPRQEYKSNGKGSYQKIPLIVLINESSASASEIFAGAMQDNDRATIIGRRSFGKGLVQQQIGFPDGSMIRLTIARYYTPSGRCIQKPDTLGITSYYKQASMSGLILQFAFTYTDDNRLKLNNFTEMMALSDYLVKQNTVDKFATYADNRGLKRRNLMIQKSHHLLQRYINSRIIYNIMDEDAWVQYLNLDDPVIRAAQKVFKDKTAFPQKTDVQEKKDQKVARSHPDAFFNREIGKSYHIVALS